MSDYRDQESINNEILRRYSVTDLREQTNDDLDRADRLFYQSTTPINIVEQGETNLILWWRIASGDAVYEVRRFKNFVWCSCKDFFFRKRACKHIAVSTGVYCQNCRLMRAKHGKHCHDCHYTINRFQTKSLATNSTNKTGVST